MEILKKVISLIKKHSTKSKGLKLLEETRIKEDLNLDSLIIMKIVMDLEDFYNIIFDSNDFANLEKISDLVSLLKNKKNL